MKKTSAEIQILLQKIYGAGLPDAADIEQLLLLEGEQTDEIFRFADNVRKQHMGDGILLRGIVEFSNHCRNRCHYCGLNKDNHRIRRYRLSYDEILASAAHIAAGGIQTVVLQSGEEDDLNPEELARVVSDIKVKFGMAVTLSLGERSREEYLLWKNAGADRYLLKIETSDAALYRSLHPGMSFENRLRCLRDLRELGYQAGSGIIVGIKGQTTATLARDIRFFADNNFDMIGIGPFIPHGDTVLGAEQAGDALMTLKAVALTRIVTKNAHLPATTALGSLNGIDYRQKGLQCGANVIMPNFTPQPYRKLYEIYPGKRCVDEPVGACTFCIGAMAEAINRFVDYSRGDTLK